MEVVDVRDLDSIDRATFQLDCHALLVANVRYDAVDVRPTGLPIVRIMRERKVFARHALKQHKWPRTDDRGSCVGAFHVAPVADVEDLQPVEETRSWHVGRDLDRVFTWSVDPREPAADAVQNAASDRGVAGPQQTVPDVL